MLTHHIQYPQQTLRDAEKQKFGHLLLSTLLRSSLSTLLISKKSAGNECLFQYRIIYLIT